MFVDYSIHWFGEQATKVLISLCKWSGPALSANCIWAIFLCCTSYGIQMKTHFGISNKNKATRKCTGHVTSEVSDQLAHLCSLISLCCQPKNLGSLASQRAQSEVWSGCKDAQADPSTFSHIWTLINEALWRESQYFPIRNNKDPGICTAWPRSLPLLRENLSHNVGQYVFGRCLGGGVFSAPDFGSEGPGLKSWRQNQAHDYSALLHKAFHYNPSCILTWLN